MLLLADDYPNGSWLGNEDISDQRVRVPISQRYARPDAIIDNSVNKFLCAFVWHLLSYSVTNF